VFSSLGVIVLAALACLTPAAGGQVNSDAAQAESPAMVFATSAASLAPGFQPRRKGDRSSLDFACIFPGYRVELEKSRMVLNDGRAPISVGYLGASRDVRLESRDAQSVTHSYFPSGDPRGWETKVGSFGRVTYLGLYPGIDLSYYGKGQNLEYDFLLQAGADPGAIQLSFDGAEKSTVDGDGNLEFSGNSKTYTLLKPVAYQPKPDGSGRDAVDVQFVVSGAKGHSSQHLGFRLGRYDHTRPLVIDPVLVYGLYIPGPAGTMYGGTVYGGTSISAMKADAAGNVYVIATLNSPYYYNYYVAQTVMKFDPTGHVLWTASLGSSSASMSSAAIAVSGAGEVFVVGEGTPGMPTTTGAFQPTDQSEEAGYIAAISADGSTLDYASYLGGSSNTVTYILSAAVDPAGKLYVSGYTDATDFPTTANAYLTKGADGSHFLDFVAKFDPLASGVSSLVYSTFVGQVASYGGVSEPLAVDSTGHAYIATDTSSSYPVTNGAYAYAGIGDGGAYVTKLNATGTGLVYSAFLGPGAPGAIAVDAAGAAYVAGTVVYYDFPVTAGAYQTAYPSGFALKLAPTGATLAYSTYLSGPSGGTGRRLVTPTSVAIPPGCASSCALRIAGTTNTIDFPLIAPLQNQYGTLSTTNNTMGFLVDINPSGAAAVYSTYLGAETTTTANPSISMDGGGNLYFAANIQGFDAPITLPAIQSAAGGFLAKITEASGSKLVAAPGTVAFPESTIVDTTTLVNQAFTLRNVGSASATLTLPFTFSSSEFGEVGSCPAVLPAGGSCVVNLSFTPSKSGQRTGTLKISSATSSTTVNLAGAGIDDFNLVSTPASLAFGDAVLYSSKSMTLTLQNDGDEVLPIVALRTNLPDYKIVSQCPAQLISGAQCTLTVTFKPTQIGLRQDDIVVQVPGFYYYNGIAYPNEYAIPVSGTGVTGAAGTGSLQFSQPTYNFGNAVVGSGEPTSYLTLVNTGKSPVTINGASIKVGVGAPADFSLYSLGYACSSLPASLDPGASCSLQVEFQPSATGAKSATLTISDSAVGSPHTVTFTGVGILSAQSLSIAPSKMTFPGQPIGVASAPQSYLIFNQGASTVAIDSAHTTGDFDVDDNVYSNCSGVSLGSGASCNISVVFLPKASGSRTGTLVLTDSISSTPQVFSLAGTGIVATGNLKAASTTLAFGNVVQGNTSPEQELIFSNTGNSAVTLNQFTATSDFAVIVPSYTYDQPNGCETVLEAGSICQVEVVFSPTNANGAESGALTAHSSAGDVKVQLTGTAVAGTQSLAITPTSGNFGPTLTGNSSGTSQIILWVVNTGSEPVSFTGTISVNNTDFTLYSGCGYPLAAGGSCYADVDFNPSTAASESAKVTFPTSAGTKTVTLSGTGVATLPAITIGPTVLSFSPQAIGTNSGAYNYSNQLIVYNNSQAPVTITSVAVTAGSSDFVRSTYYQGCVGQTLQAGWECTEEAIFGPSVAGYRTGTLTVKDSNGGIYKANLAGYGLTAVDAVALNPGSLAFPDQIVPYVNSANGAQYFSIGVVNTGNRPLTIGTISATDVSPTGDFAFYPYGGCGGSTVGVGQQCNVQVAFTPTSLGAKTGGISIPITYASNTTTTLKVKVSGTGVTANRAATMTPGVLSFPNIVVGQSSQYLYLTLTNTGNENFTTGAITGTNLTTTLGQGGDFYLPNSYCSDYYSSVTPGSTCTIGLVFTPQARGNLTGALSVSITYADGSVGTSTATLTGVGIAPAPAVQLSASQLNFKPELEGSGVSYDVQTVAVISTGNVAPNFTSVTASANFTVTQNGCAGSQITCAVSVAFTPAAKATPGTTNGTLTIVDNTPTSPHIIKLVGQTVSSTQPLVLSQTALDLGTQAAGAVGPPQVSYLSNLGLTSAVINKIALSGANPGDFTMSQTCGGTLGFSLPGQSFCAISAALTPAKTSSGARTATIVITPAKGSSLQIQLTGNVTAAP
jgi:hypothetical protein